MEPHALESLRRQALERLSRDAEAVAAVSRYCASPFDLGAVRDVPALPRGDEPHVDAWRAYARAAGADAFGYLRERLPQLQVPVRQGISASEAYRAVARRGEPFRPEDFGGETLRLLRPELLRLEIYGHPAGALPVLLTSERGDFELLVQALACRSEPEAVSPSVNAQTVAGFINWDRVRSHRAAWAASRSALEAELAWPEEMRRVAAEEPFRFYDRFMLACDRPYSDVSAAQLGLAMDEAEWLRRSTQLRLEHEFTHYATKRVFGSMSLNLLDETLCDYMGTTLALSDFRADWFLTFLGLEGFPEVRASGRIHTYAQGLTGAAFELLAALCVVAARGLERLHRERAGGRPRDAVFLALASLTLPDLACDGAGSLFDDAFQRASRLLAAPFPARSANA